MSNSAIDELEPELNACATAIRHLEETIEMVEERMRADGNRMSLEDADCASTFGEKVAVARSALLYAWDVFYEEVS